MPMLMTTAIGVGLSALFGAGAHRVMTRGERREHREIIADKDAHIDALSKNLSDARVSLLESDGKVSDLERKHGRATAEIARLKPLADAGEKALASQKARSSAGGKAAAAKRAAAKNAPVSDTSARTPRKKKAA